LYVGTMIETSGSAIEGTRLLPELETPT